MLYLNPQVIDGLYLFPDDSDTFKYYYLPQEPQIIQKNGEFQLQLIKYRGQVNSGGMLTLGVNLSVESERLQQVAHQLKNQGEIQLEPVPVIDGSVKLVLFDKIYSPNKPALFGSHQTIFSVAFTQDEVILLEQGLLESEFAPIGVIYSLDYLALRPSYSFQLHANWERVQKHIEENFSLNFVFFRLDIENVVDELIDNRIIEIKLDSFAASDVDNSDRDLFLKEIQEMVISTFFEPKLKPVKVNDNPGSFSLLPGFSYRRIDITTIDSRLLNLTVNEQTTIRRSIYPQGNLKSLLQVVKQGSLDTKQFISSIDLDDPFFRKRKVQVISRANFEEDAISSINVTLQYRDEPKTISLTSSTDRKDVEPWNSILDHDMMQREVKAKYKVIFKNVNSNERPNTLESVEQTTIFDYLEISPRELYTVIHIPIITLTSFPWEQYQSVEVNILYLDEVNQIRLAPTFFLNSKNCQQTWKMFVRDRQRRKFQYQLTYHPQLGKPYYKTSWLEAEEQIIIRHPFPQQRTLTIIPLFSWSEVRDVYVEVFYQDPTNNIDERKVFNFNQSDSVDKTFSASLRNPNQYLVNYQVTVFYQDETMIEIPQSMTLEKRLFLTPEMQGHQIIKICAAQVDFLVSQIQEIRVETRYKEAKSELITNSVFVFDASDDCAYFEFDYLDADHKSYQHRTTYLFVNGFQGTTEWQESDAETLMLEPRTSQSFQISPAIKDLQIEIFAKNIDWQQIKSVKVALVFEDKDKGIKASERRDFRKGDEETFFWQVELKDSHLKTYKWQAIFSFKDSRKDKVYYPGSTSKDWEETDKKQLFLKDYLSKRDK